MIKISILQLIINLVIGLGIGGYLGYQGYKKGSMSTSGFVGFLIVSFTLSFFGNWAWFVIFFAVYYSVSFWTRFKHNEKLFMTKLVDKSGPRDISQVIANLLVSTCIAVLYWFYPSIELVYAFLGSLAAATADTWASEIGVLSKQQPRMLFRLNRVPIGTSGAISSLGTIAGLGGALFIGLLGGLVLTLSGNIDIWYSPILPVLLGGALGFFVDSVLGAYFQALYYSEKLQMQTENTSIEGDNLRLIQGYKFIDNEVVNFACTLVGAISAYAIGIFF